jgi:phosphoribosylaminoimidazole carboxylase PurE protein
MSKPIVGIIMGSDSDLDVMGEAAKMLDSFGIANEVRIISAHRTPDIMSEYAASAKDRGLKVIIAGAGGSAHLPGMTASHTPIPVISVPIRRENQGHEAFWSNIKMPPGIPLATMPENSAKNAALMAVEILALSNSMIADKYDEFRKNQHDGVVKTDAEVQKNWSKIIQD